MKHLKPFKEPPPPEKQACCACETFAPEVLVPIGDAAVPMCWLCAHHVVDHDVAPHHAHAAECECTPQEIYPHRAFETPGTVLAAGYQVQPDFMGKHSKRLALSPVVSVRERASRLKPS